MTAPDDAPTTPPMEQFCQDLVVVITLVSEEPDALGRLEQLVKADQNLIVGLRQFRRRRRKHAAEIFLYLLDPPTTNRKKGETNNHE